MLSICWSRKQTGRSRHSADDKSPAVNTRQGGAVRTDRRLVGTMQGFVVQSRQFTQQHPGGCVNYFGIYRCVSWPFTDFNGYSRAVPQCETMSALLEQLWDDSGVYACPLCQELEDYLHICVESGIKPRIMYIQTAESMERPPLAEGNYTFLGYDVIYYSDFFSAVYDDLFVNIPAPMEKDAKKLNDNGLFDNYSDALEFIENIARCREMGIDVEWPDGFEPVRLFRVNELPPAGGKRLT